MQVSIGRRLLDPLSEYIKIEISSIGVRNSSPLPSARLLLSPWPPPAAAARDLCSQPLTVSV